MHAQRCATERPSQFILGTEETVCLYMCVKRYVPFSIWCIKHVFDVFLTSNTYLGGVWGIFTIWEWYSYGDRGWMFGLWWEFWFFLGSFYSKNKVNILYTVYYGRVRHFGKIYFVIFSIFPLLGSFLALLGFYEIDIL